MPSSASASAVAFEIDMNDSNAVVDRTIRTCRFSVSGGTVDLIGEWASSLRNGDCADSRRACILMKAQERKSRQAANLDTSVSRLSPGLLRTDANVHSFGEIDDSHVSLNGAATPPVPGFAQYFGYDRQEFCGSLLGSSDRRWPIRAVHTT